MNVESITIPILMRLFAIKIVASNFAGFSSNFSITEEDFSVSFFNCSKCEEESEKKAISLPDIRAEHNNKNMSMMMDTTVPAIPILRKKKLVR